jgi:hypothetical protein
MEAPPGFEPGMEVLQTSALPLGYGADERWEGEACLAEALARSRRPTPAASRLRLACRAEALGLRERVRLRGPAATARPAFAHPGAKAGAGNGIRTRDFDLGKVALYH